MILSIDKVTKAIKIFGDEKSVDLMVDDGPLMQRIQDILRDVRRQNESSKYKMYTRVYQNVEKLSESLCLVIYIGPIYMQPISAKKMIFGAFSWLGHLFLVFGLLRG